MAGSRSGAPVRVGRPVASQVAGVSRVCAEVDGVDVWFETQDTSLRAAAEAFCSAFLLPALHQGRPLESLAPLDAVWLANAGQLMEVWRGWWRYPVLAPRGPQAPAPPPRAPATPEGPAGSALFFSGGVDSFYSLLRCDVAPDRLVTVQGFDIPLDDESRMSAAEATLRAVGSVQGVRTIVLRTNLRDHPLMRAAAWGRAHGGALAAAGHALGEGVAEVLISSSVSLDRKHQWGSHWMTDPLFSSSGVRIREVGMERRRLQKLRLIADEPLVRRHLRVCWENRSAAGNCSRCSKCLMTRLVLHDCGVLDEFPGLEGSATLAHDLDEHPCERGFLEGLAGLAASPDLDPEVCRATRALLGRSRHVRSLPVRWRRSLMKQVLRWTGRGRT